jgi:PKD repeat protein
LDGGYADLGSTPAGTPLVATFTVTNSGTTNLTLTNPITVTGTGYTLGTGFGSTTIAAGATTTFTVNFNSAVGGSFTGNVSFATNDCDEGTYNFVMYCDATTTPPIADFTGTPTTICAGSTVTFTNLSTGAASYLWNFGAGASPATSTATNPTVTFNTVGSNTITLTATNAFGSDTETKTNYILVVSSTGVALPISEGFVVATFPPVGWSVQNNNASGTTWVRTTAAGFAPTATSSMMFDNFTFNDADDDEVRLPGASFTGLSSAQLQFDVAYAPYNATNFDGLEVLVSTDCGVTYTSVYSKSNTVLATAPAITTIFTPTTAQWRTETVNLTSYIGNSKVIVAFRNLSGYGNRLFVDNINLTGVVSTAPPTASFTGAPTTICAGQSVTYTNTSTGSPTSYLWTFTGGTPATSTATNPTVTYATAGTYTVALTATNGSGSNTSTQTNYITVNALPSAPTVTVTNNCGNSVLSTTGSGLVWSTGATTASITVTTPGTYTVTQTVGGCTSSSGSGVAAPLAIPSAPIVTVTNNCGNSVLSATGSGLVWSTGATTASITVSTAGTYTVTQTVGGCTSTAGSGVAAPLAIPSAPIVTVTNNCGNSVLSATGSGLVWSTGATTASITVTPGTYTVTQTVGGCTSTAGSGVAAPLVIPSAPIVTVTNNCGNSVLSATGSGLVWSTGATTASITVSTAGTYTVTQTVGGCTSTAGSGVAAPLAQPIITQGTIVNPTVCGATNGSITVNGAGTGNISWTGAASGSATGITLPYLIPNLSAGAYSIIFNASCSSIPLSVSLVDPAAPSAPVVTVTNNCGNSVLTAAGSGLLWSTGATTASITVSTAGTYTVTQTVGGCTSASSSGVAAPLAIPSAPAVTVTNNCGNSVLTATGSGLVWSTGATTASITVPTAGTYTVTQTVGGCTSASGSGIANPAPGPTAPIVAVVNNCGNSILTASGTGPYLWSTGETTGTIIVSAAGNYTVTETIGGCTSAAGTGIAAPNAIPAIPIITVLDKCGTTDLTTTATGSLMWSTSETTSLITVTMPGTYFVSQTVNGCTSAVGSAVANPNTVPTVNFAPLADICINAPAYTLVEGSPAGGVYSGTGVAGGQFDPSVSGYGVFTIVYNCIDANGCSGSNQQPIIVGCADVEEAEDFNLSVFPNPTNGLFVVTSTGDLIEKIRVFDAAGRIVQSIGNSQKLEQVNIDLSNFGEGVYSVEIAVGASVLHECIILTK